MAEFTPDPGNPAFVYAPDGRLVAREFLGPGDTVVGETPAPAPAVAPAAASPMTAADVLGKLDQVPRSGAPPPLQTVASSTSTSTQRGVDPSVLEPSLQRLGESAEQQASAVEQAGEERAQRGEQAAMSQATSAFGRHTQASAEADQAGQRAEIARKNELALALEKDPEIDPDRFVREMSTGAQIGTIILAAFNGAFRGATGQTGNDVLDMLDRRIDQDIAAQKEQIQSGRVRRGNLVAYFSGLGLREEEAERAARSTSWAMLDRMAEAEAARIGAGDARSDAALVAQQIRAKAGERKEELRLSLGTDRSTSTTTTQRAAPGGAGGAGGLESFTKQLAARKAYEEAGATPEQLTAFDRAMGIPSPGGESKTARDRRTGDAAAAELSEAQGKAQAASDAIDALGREAGLTRDPKTGKWTGGSDVFTEGSFWDTDEQRSSAFAAAVEAYGRMQSGGVIGAEEREAFEDMLSARRGSVLANKLNAAEVTIRSRQQAASAERGSGGAAPEGWR